MYLCPILHKLNSKVHNVGYNPKLQSPETKMFKNIMDTQVCLSESKPNHIYPHLPPLIWDGTELHIFHGTQMYFFKLLKY